MLVLMSAFDQTAGTCCIQLCWSPTTILYLVHEHGNYTVYSIIRNLFFPLNLTFLKKGRGKHLFTANTTSPVYLNKRYLHLRCI